jgi:ATP-binding cassette subfamily B protein
MADVILVIDDGRIIDRGTHEELLERNSYYRQLYNLQFQYQEGWIEPAAAAVPGETEEAFVYNANGNTSHAAKPRPSGNLTRSDDTVFGKIYDSRTVARMARYFTPYKVALPLTIISTLAYTFTIVVNPYIVGQAINGYIVAANLSGLNLIVLFFLGNAVLQWGAYYTQIRAEAKLGQGILLTLRRQVFDHIQRLSVAFFDRNEAGRVMSRLQNDVGEMGDFLDSGAFWVLGEIISLAAIAMAMFAMEPELALITLSVVPFLFLFIGFWQKKARQSFISVRKAISAVNAALQENISGIRVIQSLSREDLNSRQFEKLNRTHLLANLESARRSAVVMPLVELLVAIAMALIILYGGVMVHQGLILVGTLVAFALYVQQFFDPIRTLTMEYAQLQRAMASSARVFELLDVEPEVVSRPDAPLIQKLDGDIRFEHVSFSYVPEVEVLQDINLHIHPGETIALVGPTGAGKSTVISLIARFYDVTRGRILVDGQDIRDIDLASYRSRLGLVLQEPFLFSGSIRDNIRYGNLAASDGEIEAAARTVGAHDFIVKLENGYDYMLHERGRNISMGQRQLISLARALVANPAILLLDEATANVDSFSEHILQEAIERLLEGRTAVIIAHRLSTVRNADRIIVLDKGRIVEEGRHDTLLAAEGLYSRLYEMTRAPVTGRIDW